ncbi:hypothetical protein FJ364_05590, partial [Candidatus Dependentiae bacterium]|nr:hypothetical protein [Candidatus Dependentiae bacterium]
MPLTSEFNSKKALRQNLYANCFYEILQLMHLVLVFFALRHDDAAKYALLICFTNIIGKFCDAGIGGATPKLLKTIPHQAVSLFSVIVQQAFIIVPTVALTFATLTQFKGYIVFFIIFCACFDGFATLSRYAVYGTLKGREVINTEVVIMSLRVLTLLPFAFFKASMEMIFAHFVFFLLLNSTAIAVLAWQITMRTSRPLNFLYAKPMHLTVLKIRSQVFSTKIWKDLLSVHALTPIFAYIHGIEYTWLFFILTSILSGLHNIIKLGIGQTAAGLFSQLSPSKHASTTSFLNHALSILIGCSLLFGITGYCMFLYFSQISPDIQTVLLYTVCFGLLIFSDLLPL